MNPNLHGMFEAVNSLFCIPHAVSLFTEKHTVFIEEEMSYSWFKTESANAIFLVLSPDVEGALHK